MGLVIELHFISIAFIQKLKQHTLFPLFEQLTLAGYSPEVLLDAS